MNKLTKISRAVLAIAMTLMVALPSFAHDFEVGGIYYNYLDETAKTVEVTYSGSVRYTGSVTIPSLITYSGTSYSVTSIGNTAFSNCTGLTSVTIPNSVTTIGNNAFKGCTGLTTITIPNSVTSIDYSAFRNCTGLTEVNISDLSAWCKIDFVSEGANPILYANKLSLNGEEIKDLVIPNDITEIKKYAFYNFDGLTSVTIPNSVTSIGAQAFNGCTGLTTITIPNSVTSIGSVAFYNCTGLTSITIPNSVTTIGNNAFSNCTGLTSITIPNSVTSIGNEAFYGCSGLTEVNISDLSAWCKIDFENYSANPLCYAKKFKLNGAEIKDLVIPNDVTEIKEYAFYGFNGLTSVTIPNSVTTIGDYAFYYCDGLTTITIPNSVISIGDYAFRYCTGLTTITIPNSVTSIGSEAFYYCSGLISVTIGNSVTSIGAQAFNYCRYLDTIISLNPTPPVCANSNSFYNYSSATLYVPKDSYAKYFVDEEWGQFTNIKKIEILVSSITLNNSTIELDKGSTATLSATIAPSNATIKNIVWTSSNPQIATVNKSGKVTALTPGIATITAKSIDGSNVSASCKVTVNSVIPTITLSQTEANLPVNDVMTLSYEVIPLITPVEWSTSNENVAYIKKNADNSVMVVGMADGVATITATMVDNGQEYTASCVVTVGTGISGVEGFEVDNNVIEVARYDIHGRLLSEPTPGINIVKYSDGTTRKEIVKN